MIRACASIALLVLLLVAVSQRVYYQTYALDAAPMTTSSGVRIQVPATGTEEILKRRMGEGADAVVEEVTGTLTARYEKRGAFRFWEEWMSV